MLFELTEYGSVDEPYTFPPRPDPLDLGSLLGPFECWGVKTYIVWFEDGGRYFQAQAVFGRQAPVPLHDEVARSLDTLHVDPLPLSEQPAAACQRGEWIACSQAAWVYEVINRAHVVHLGHLGNQAILGLSGHRSFALWTTGGSMPNGRCGAVQGTKVCRVGGRLVWRVQRLLVWVEPAPSPDASLHTTPSLPTGHVLEALVEASQAVSLVQP